MSLEILRKFWWAFEWSCPDILPCPAFHDMGQAPEASYTTASFCHACLCLSGPLHPRWDCLSLLSSRKVVVFIEKEKDLSLHRAALCKIGPGVACADLSLNLSLSNTHTHRDMHTHTHTETHTQRHTHRDTHTHNLPFSLASTWTYVIWKEDHLLSSTVSFPIPHEFSHYSFSGKHSLLPSQTKKKKNHFQIVEAHFIVSELCLITSNSQYRLWITLHRLRKTKNPFTFFFLWFSGPFLLSNSLGLCAMFRHRDLSGGLPEPAVQAHRPSLESSCLLSCCPAVHTAPSACKTFRSFLSLHPNLIPEDSSSCASVRACVCVCVYVGVVPLQLLYFFLSASASRKSLFSFSSSTSSKGVWFPKGLGNREFRCYALSALQYSFPNATLDRGAFSITDYYKIMTTVTSAIQ